VDRIHYDEAWYAYARFNPLYDGRYGMHRGPRSKDEATVSVTHSTHKLLAALSQASMIHIRCGKVPVEPGLFNEAFMMHTSTSPQYSIIASNDVAAKMMSDAGPALTDESIREAIDFRQEMLRVGQQLRARKPDTWWFTPWNTEQVDDVPFVDGPFVDAATDRLATSSEPWCLSPNASWHGFGDLGADYCMLDPIKVTVLTPGLNQSGKLEDWGIPAAIVSNFLATHGIVVEKTEPYSFLVLFSIGITKGKWGSLVASLLEFKELYDANAPLEQVLPHIVDANPERYQSLTIRELVDEMHQAIHDHDILSNMDRAFMQLPEPVLPPREAYGRLVHREVEQVPASKLCGRTLAVQVVPYPPGIPLLMPGERFTEQTAAIGDFLLGLQDFDAGFPGFEHDIHGVEVGRDHDGPPYYRLYCLSQ
jgi:arginine decarboxylase